MVSGAESLSAILEDSISAIWFSQTTLLWTYLENAYMYALLRPIREEAAV